MPTQRHCLTPGCNRRLFDESAEEPGGVVEIVCQTCKAKWSIQIGVTGMTELAPANPQSLASLQRRRRKRSS